MPNNTDFEDLYLQSEAAIREGDLIRAKQLIEQMLMEDPRSAIAHNSMGWFYRVQFEDYRKAEQHFRTALRNNPNYPHAFWNYAYMLTDLERFEDLERLLEQGMNRPAIQKTLIYNQLGEMREVQGRFDEALWAYQQAIRRSTKSDQIETLWDAIERVEEKVALDLHMQQWEAGNMPSPEGPGASAGPQDADRKDPDHKEKGLRNQLRQWRAAVQGPQTEGAQNTSHSGHPAPHSGSGLEPFDSASGEESGKDPGKDPGKDKDAANELEQFLRGDWFKPDADGPQAPTRGGGSRGPHAGSTGSGPTGPGSELGLGPAQPRKPGRSDGQQGQGGNASGDPGGTDPTDPEGPDPA